MTFNNELAPKKPDNYMIPAILATIFCSLPSGIAAIVFAARVNPLFESGQHDAALENASRAKFWSWISLPLFVVWVGVLIAIEAL